jgi:crotonobetainyl-CoA:carnitine CoA-transferase CaiB-like acyl-CoA transferase
VLKIARPEQGDVYRRQGPVFANGESASFLTLNRGKRSIELDLADPRDRERLESLLDETDVLVENMRPGALAKHGLDYASLSRRHPRLVYCSISAYGQDGPLAEKGGYDVTIQALSGLMAATGHPGQPPAKIPVAALDFGAALYAVVGVLAALRSREATGQGARVQTSLLEASTAWFSMHIVTMLLGGAEPEPMGSRSPFFAPYEAYRTHDGYVVVVGTGGRDSWASLCATLGLDNLRDDPRFATNADRVENAEALREKIERVLVTKPTAAWVAALEQAGVACAPVQRLSQVLRSEQLQALGMIGSVEHATAGTVPSVRLPVRIDGVPTTATLPPPALGASNDEGYGAE